MRIKSFINDKKTQDSRTSERILGDKECVALVSKYFTLALSPSCGLCPIFSRILNNPAIDNGLVTANLLLRMCGLRKS
mgnify:CR=1 FL=1